MRTFPKYLFKRVQAISAGGHHSLFLRNDSTAWAVGRNDYGQLGDRTTIMRQKPVQVLTDLLGITAAEFYSVFVRTDGTMWVAGLFESGLPRDRHAWNVIQTFNETQVQKMSIA